MLTKKPGFKLKRELSLLIVGVAVMASSCNSSDSSGTPRLKMVDLTSNQIQQKEIALKARDKMFGALFQELMSSMSSVGPAKSIGVCKEKAPQIAKQVGEEDGVRIGRTSVKLRNFANQPPTWAEPFVHGRVDEEVVVVLRGEALGVLLPIRLNATCTVCHGKSDQVAPEVAQAIRSAYRGDKAVGFSEGDLRGYFWVEVPKIASK